MRLQCAQEALADALATVGRVVSTRSTLPVLTNVLLDAEAGGGLRLVASIILKVTLGTGRTIRSGTLVV